jgi:hypothetical protein
MTMRTMMDTARQLGASDVRVCRDWLMHKPGQPIPVIAPYLTKQQLQVLLKSIADAVATAADPGQRTAVPSKEPAQLALVVRRLQSRLTPAQVAVFDNLDNPRHEPAVLCSAIVEMYREILRLPEREAGPLLRYLLINV